MRLFHGFLFFALGFSLFAIAPLTGQTAPPPEPQSLHKPEQIFAAAAPFYDFSSASLKPWHLTASYQLYDPNGQPSERGTWEYWWASPTLYRSTWTRGSSTRSEWHTADGKIIESASGENLHFLEVNLPENLFAPLPKPDVYDPAKTWLDRETVPLGNSKAACVRVVRKSMPPILGQPQSRIQLITYCFDPKVPALILAVDALSGITSAYGDFIQMQGRYLARSFAETVNNRKLLTITVDAVSALGANDSALSPPAHPQGDALPVVNVAYDSMTNHALKTPVPNFYPSMARQKMLSGTVLVEARIGVDGKVEGAQVISSPGTPLTNAAEEAISHWEYKPYLQNGSPTEVITEIEMVYKLGS